MSFTYNFTTQPLLSQVRLLVADTDAANPIFDDEEINQFLYLSSSAGVYTSGQFFSTASPAGNNPAPAIYSVYRAAALGLDSIASNRSRLASIIQLLDVKLDPSKASAALRAQAKEYRDVAANDGSFAIAEMVNDQFSARERVWKQFLRIFAA